MDNLGNYIEGVGYIFRGLSEILTPPRDFNAGYNDVMKGLGMFGLHNQIIKVMKEDGLDPKVSVEPAPNVAEKK